MFDSNFLFLLIFLLLVFIYFPFLWSFFPLFLNKFIYFWMLIVNFILIILVSLFSQWTLFSTKISLIIYRLIRIFNHWNRRYFNGKLLIFRSLCTKWPLTTFIPLSAETWSTLTLYCIFHCIFNHFNALKSFFSFFLSQTFCLVFFLFYVFLLLFL